MHRRAFLAGGAAAGLLIGSRAWGRAWGEGPSSAAGLLLPEGVRAESVLEVFLYGGLSPWESFYAVPDHGQPGSDFPNQQWHLFSDNQRRSTYQACGIAPAEHLSFFGTDAAGADVHLGPNAMAIRERADLLERLRVVVMRHDLEPHEAAIPYALAGMRLGSPRLVGMGAHLQRHWLERAPRVQPYSYVLQPETIIGTDNTRAADAVGLHPGSARPLALKINADQAFLRRLGRGRLGNEAAAFDDLVELYGQKVRGRYTANGQPLRAAALADHESAVQSLRNAGAIQELLGEGFMTPAGAQSCGVYEPLAPTRMGLKAAVDLLTHPTTPARYVNVVDGGLYEADGGGGYDTHADHLAPQADNTNHVLRELVSRINLPGEGDPTKLDLDRTMVVITTEFGRTPYRQDGGAGTNHHPYGYVNTVLGGPITAAQAGVHGAIGPDGRATSWTTPAEFRAALLGACGLYPFAHESFAVGDIRNMQNEAQALEHLLTTVLGRT